MLRLAHTLKGAARVVKQREIADQAHAIEDALAPFRERGGAVPRDGIEATLKALDEMAQQMAALAPPAGGRQPPPTVPLRRPRAFRPRTAPRERP